jgi:hypothetical protein
MSLRLVLNLGDWPMTAPLKKITHAIALFKQFLFSLRHSRLAELIDLQCLDNFVVPA